MDELEKRQLLKEEYIHLQNVIEEFDGRAVSIKAWSVSFSLAAIAGAFASHAASVLLLASFSTVLFWIIEGFWKTFQYAYYDRSGKTERFFAGEIKNLVPFQIGSSWYKKWKSGGLKRLIKIMCWPHVALPHVIVLALGIILYLLIMLNKITI